MLMRNRDTLSKIRRGETEKRGRDVLIWEDIRFGRNARRELLYFANSTTSTLITPNSAKIMTN